MFAVRATLIGVPGFVAIGEHHIVADLLFRTVGVGSRAGTLAVSARPSLLLASLGHGLLLFVNRTALNHGIASVAPVRVLGLVAALPEIAVHVVVALLIHAAAAHGPFAVPNAGFRFVDGIVPSGAIG